ncbi:spermine synthase [Filobacillus milosensis]|uniref:Spermine synthase n=1 Tax=Filobacillus milosensis TaxID=94137 RepID=A0A4Y8IHF5_9BACI|nr:spermine synthase [Filobacillus milosensis]TFB18503.1 spermine synthase [Filobacillus milosensis]
MNLCSNTLIFITKKELFKDVSITFIFALSMIMYEIFLTRLFAVILDYNYAFLVISLATLGIGLGGYLAYQFERIFPRIYSNTLLIQVIIMITITALMFLIPFQGLAFYSMLSCTLFLFTGYVLASLFRKWRGHIHLFYFADLLGAGLGTVLVIFLMNQLSPIKMIFTLALGILFCGFVFSFHSLNKVGKLAMTVVLIFISFNIFHPLLTADRFHSYHTSPYTTFFEQEGDIVYTKWDSFSRTDVYNAKDEDFLYMTIDGGAVSPISRFNGNLKSVEYLKFNTSDLAFRNIDKNDRVLIIGSGGGQEVLTAEMAGFSHIEALDINRGSFDAVNALRFFSSNIFDRPGVKTIVADGRNYVRETNNTYDMIYLSLVTKQSDSGLGLSLSENFIYTDEAIEDYFAKLEDNGRLAFLLHDEIELVKILNSAKKYYKEQGIKEKNIKNHMIVVGSYHIFGHIVGTSNTIERPLILLKKTPLSQEEAEGLFANITEISQIPIHVPYYINGIKKLDQIEQENSIPIRANQDNQPFFYHKKNGIPISLWVIFLVTVLISLIASMFYRRKLSIKKNIYFAGIGIGFMLLEITLIQRLTLPIGHPVLSFVLVIGTLLIFGGIGSYFSHKWKNERRQRYLPLILVSIFASLIFLLINIYYHSDLALEPSIRILFVIVLLMPLGFFLGMPFPYGVSQLKEQEIAVSWGINGLMTVVGSLLSAILSLSYGFNTTIMVGIGIYFLLFIIHPYLKV